MKNLFYRINEDTLAKYLAAFIVLLFYFSFYVFVKIYYNLLRLPMGLASFLALLSSVFSCYFFVTLIDKAIKYRSVGILSFYNLLFHKENIFELNLRAQFANFKQRYLHGKKFHNSELCEVPFEQIVSSAEERTLLFAKNPKNFYEGINYEEAVYASVLNELLDHIIGGTFLFGHPTSGTITHIQIYSQLVRDAHEKGLITEEVKYGMLNELHDLVKNHG